MGYSVGDNATLSLQVTPSDATTAVTLLVTLPDGTSVAPSVNGGPSDWTALVPLTLAGLYVATWTVTGTGNGSEQHRISVAPNGPIVTGWATTTDLAEWLQAAPPTDADRLLARASETVTDAVVGWYAVDDLGVPVEAYVVDALRSATCAQVEHWLDVGEDNDIDGYDEATAVGAGGVSVSRRPAKLAPRARRLLRAAGLLQVRAW